MATTMRAVQVLGEPSSPTLTYSTAFPIPEATGDTVLIRVSAAGITADELSWPELYKSNRIPGHDLAGTIVALGPDYKGTLQVGDDVFSMIRPSTQAGAQADYVPVTGSEVALKPSRISMTEAAALPIPVLTAWEALHEHATIAKGSRVLVTGASGAVGIMLVQMASKLLGAEVVALASPRNHEHLRTLGAGHCVDYNSPGWETSFGSVDAVLDTVGSEVYRKSWRSLRAGGTVVTVADPPPAWAFDKSGAVPEELGDNPDAKYKYFVVTASGESLARVGRLLDEGTLKPLPVVEFEAERALEGWQYAKTRGRDGKVVISFSRWSES